MKKRLIAMLLAVLLLTMSAVPALAAAPKVKNLEYKGNGVIEVEFTSENVRYKNAKVVVKNSSGKKLSTKIVEKDEDDIRFKVSGLKAGTKYTYTISGVRAGKSGSFGKVKGSFTTPSGSPEISRVRYDASDRELDIEFNTNVQFKGLDVTVLDSTGNELTVYGIDRGDDDLDMHVKGMVSGRKYTVVVEGVRIRGVGSYTTVSKVFTA